MAIDIIKSTIEAEHLNNSLKARSAKMNVDVSFITCVSDIRQYKDLVVSSLLKNQTKKQFDIIPVFNFDNSYSAARALNIGMSRSRSDLVVLCHQDAGFFEPWIDILYDRIEEIEKTTKNWGVLGTGGVMKHDEKFGIAYNSRKEVIWKHGDKSKHIAQVQTVDEVCVIIKKSSGLMFDELFDGFHFYGADIALESITRGFVNYGIWNPTIHDWTGRSLVTGKEDYIRQLNLLCNKWKDKFDVIRTDTAVIENGVPKTFFPDYMFSHAMKAHASTTPQKKVR
jgi:glycosyltransferase involved in cell wall biosynthesis